MSLGEICHVCRIDGYRLPRSVASLGERAPDDDIGWQCATCGVTVRDDALAEVSRLCEPCTLRREIALLRAQVSRLESDLSEAKADVARVNDCEQYYEHQ